MATRAGFRNILGDITKQQNIPQKVALVDAKVTTRQAAEKRLHADVVSDGLATERFFAHSCFFIRNGSGLCLLV